MSMPLQHHYDSQNLPFKLTILSLPFKLNPSSKPKPLFDTMHQPPASKSTTRYRQHAIDSSTIKRILPTSEPAYQTRLKGRVQGDKSVAMAYARTFEPDTGLMKMERESVIAEHELIRARSEYDCVSMNNASDERNKEAKAPCVHVRCLFRHACLGRNGRE